MNKSSLIILVVFAFAVLLPQQATSYVFSKLQGSGVAKVSKWCDQNMKCASTRTMEVIQCSLGDSSTRTFQALERSGFAWNSIYGAYDKLAVAESNDPCPSSGSISYVDGNSEMAQGSSDVVDGALGVTIYGRKISWLGTSNDLDDFGNYTHVDIWINSTVNWYLSEPTCNETGGAYLTNTAIHEFGHALGLAHENRRILSYVKDGRLQKQYPDFCGREMTAADETRALRVLYNSGNVSQDIGVHATTIGSTAPRSSADRWSVRLGSNTDVVCEGESVDFPFTVQNRGMSDATYDRDYWLVRRADLNIQNVGTETNRLRSADGLKFTKRMWITPPASLFDSSNNGGRNDKYVQLSPDWPLSNEESVINNTAILPGPPLLLNNCN